MQLRPINILFSSYAMHLKHNMFVEPNNAEKQHTLNFLATRLFAKIHYFERNKCGRSQAALLVTRNLLGPSMVA